MKNAILAAAAATLLALTIPALTQTGPPGPGVVPGGGGQGPGDHMGQNTVTQDQFNQLSDYVDQAHRLTAERAHGKTEADLKAEDMASAGRIVTALRLSCELTDAQLFAQGSHKASGQAVTSQAYEVACTNGMGYLVVSEEPGKPFGLSCFTAEAKRADDAAHGRTGSAVCLLAANADLKTVATGVLARAGKSCSVRDVSWLGLIEATSTEYVEVACTDGTGYVLAAALPGSSAPPKADTCQDSAARGIPCKLTGAGGGTPSPTITVQTFKDAIAQRGVACDASDTRVIGQQNHSKRYVVEFKCTQHPEGLVALIPLAGNAQPFETLSCAAAAKIGAACKLTATP